MSLTDETLLVISEDQSVIERAQQLSNDVRIVTHIDDIDAQKQSSRISIVLLDTNLTSVDPFKVIEQFGKIVIVVTDSADRIDEFLEAGAIDFLQKPFSSMMLKTRINHSIAQTMFPGFLSTFRHDIKAPMTNIQGYTSLLLSLQQFGGEMEDVSLEQQKDFLEVILRRSRQLPKMIDDFSDIALIDSKNFQFQLQNTDLVTILDPILSVDDPESLNARLDAKGQRLVIEIPANFPPVKAHQRMINVFNILLNNANFYSPANTTITLAAKTTDDGFAEITIQDEGIGIKEGDLHKIFKQKFWRADDDVVRYQLGSGVGLYIARHIVEAHGGRIWFETEYGKGSTFHFTIPLA
jgi:signal transduction histidine kinase